MKCPKCDGRGYTQSVMINCTNCVGWGSIPDENVQDIPANNQIPTPTERTDN